MAVLNHKVDFAVVIAVRNANPNGDPLDGNRPRTTFSGNGEMSAESERRKIRNRLQDEGQRIFVQSDDRRDDECRSLHARADSEPELAACVKEIKDGKKSKDDYAAIACSKWYDVRAFGQVFAFKNPSKKKGKGAKTEDGEQSAAEEGDGVSIGVRGPVSIQPAFSIEPVNITSTQITKSVNLESESNPDRKGADTMGMRHRVDYGVYVTYGAINVQLAQKTGFSEEDALVLKEAIRTMFRNDESSARPAGSMEVLKLIWWDHNNVNGQYSSAKVHRTLKVSTGENGAVNITTDDLEGLVPEMIDGE